MNCREFERMIEAYWDSQLTDLQRFKVDQHVRHCVSCRLEFELWEESERLIRSSKVNFVSQSVHFQISQDVMKRIYQENPWAVPAAKRAMNVSALTRRWMTGVAVLFFILFISSFYLSAVIDNQTFVFGEGLTAKKHHLVGIQPVGSVAEAVVVDTDSSPFQGVVATIGEPLPLSPVDGLSGKKLLLITSLLGSIMTVLGMTWLSTVKSK